MGGTAQPPLTAPKKGSGASTALSGGLPPGWAGAARVGSALLAWLASSMAAQSTTTKMSVTAKATLRMQAPGQAMMSRLRESRASGAELLTGLGGRVQEA